MKAQSFHLGLKANLQLLLGLVFLDNAKYSLCLERIFMLTIITTSMSNSMVLILLKLELLEISLEWTEGSSSSRKVHYVNSFSNSG